MAGFRTEFYQTFFSELKTVLEDEAQLKAAWAAFAQNSPLTRFYCKDQFGITQWHDEDIGHLSAAVFEAIARASEAFIQNSEDAPLLVSVYGSDLKRLEIPNLTQGIDPDNAPLQAFCEKISTLLPKTALESPPATSAIMEPQEEDVEEAPFIGCQVPDFWSAGFFNSRNLSNTGRLVLGAGITAVAAAAAAATLSFGSSNP